MSDMPWARLEGGFYDHPKVDGLSDVAFRAWVTSISWSVLHLTDGVLPARLPVSITRGRRPRDVDEMAQELVAARCWETGEDGGWLIRNFAEYQPTRESVEREREAGAERKRRWEERQKERVQNDGVTPLRERSERVRNTAPSHPIPSHREDQEKRTSSDDDGFTAFWDSYPARNGKKVEKRKAVAAWRRLKPAEREAAQRAVEHYAGACDAGLTIAKDAFRWLQSRAWEDWQEPARAVAPRPAEPAGWAAVRALTGGES